MQTNIGRGLTALAGLALLHPLPAFAQEEGDESDLAARFAALEAQIHALEGEVMTLRADLAREREQHHAAPAVLAQAPAARAPVAAPATAPVRTTAPAASDGPTFKIGGFFKFVASATRTDGGSIAPNSVGHDFYVPATIPIGGQPSGTSFEAHAKQTRLNFSASTTVGEHKVSGVVEADFQTAPGSGNQRITNAYAPGLRRAFLVFDDFLLGQEWTNFQYLGALPETADYLGPSEGTVFVRQAQLRYTKRLDDQLSLSIAAENPSTVTTLAGTTSLVENDLDRVPDFTARLGWKTGGGELSFAGLLRNLHVGGASGEDSATGWGASFAGKLPFGGDKRHDLRFMVTHGEGAGRYIGLNLAPDAVLETTPFGARLVAVPVTAGFAALRLGWSSQWRSTFMGSLQSIDYPDHLQAAAATDQAWSASANLFYSPIKPIDLGLELRHGERRTNAGDTGKLDRIDVIAKYSF